MAVGEEGSLPYVVSPMHIHVSSWKLLCVSFEISQMSTGHHQHGASDREVLPAIFIGRMEKLFSLLYIPDPKKAKRF